MPGCQMAVSNGYMGMPLLVALLVAQPGLDPLEQRGLGSLYSTGLVGRYQTEAPMSASVVTQIWDEVPVDRLLNFNTASDPSLCSFLVQAIFQASS